MLASAYFLPEQVELLDDLHEALRSGKCIDEFLYYPPVDVHELLVDAMEGKIPPIPGGEIMDAAYSSTNILDPVEAQLDRISTKELMHRYNLQSRTALTNRLKGLGIKAVKDGQRFYVTVEEVERLDKLHNCLRAGNTINDCIAPPLDSKALKSPVNKLEDSRYASIAITSNKPDTPDLIQLVHEIAAAIRPQTNELQHLECLERAAASGWLLSTKEIKQLLQVKPHGEVFNRGSFAFIRSGKIGNSSAWRVTKFDPASTPDTSTVPISPHTGNPPISSPVGN